MNCRRTERVRSSKDLQSTEHLKDNGRVFCNPLPSYINSVSETTTQSFACVCIRNVRLMGVNQTLTKTYTVLLHDSQKLDNDLGAWSDHDLSLASLFGIVDGIQAVVKY